MLLYLRPMRPSSSAVGICPFPDLSVLVLQDDNYCLPAYCTCTHQYTMQTQKKSSVVPPIQGSSKPNYPDRGAENDGQALRLATRPSCNEFYDCLSLLVRVYFLTAHTEHRVQVHKECVVFATSCGSTPYGILEYSSVEEIG